MRLPIFVLAMALASPGARREPRRRRDGVAVGAAVRRPAADHRGRTDAVPEIWHAHYGKIAALWAALALVPIAVVYGAGAAVAALTHALLGEFLSFIVVLFALYTVAGGILVSGDLRGTPLVNTALLAFGTGIASIVGTTGAAMILIRPVIRANQRRRTARM